MAEILADASEVILEMGLSSAITEEERAIISAALTKAKGAVRRHLRYDPVQLERTEFYPSQDFFRSSLGRRWEANNDIAFVRSVSGAVTDELQVRHIPIRSLPAIDLRIDFDGRAGTKTGGFGSETLKVEGTDFWPNYDRVDSDGNSMCNDGIIRSIGLWPTQAGSVKIIYTAGYTSEELHGQESVVDASPIMDAVVDETIRRAKKAFVNKKQEGAGWVAGPMKKEKLGDYSYELGDSIVARLFGSTTDLLGETKDKLDEFVNYGYDLGG